MSTGDKKSTNSTWPEATGAKHEIKISGAALDERLKSSDFRLPDFLFRISTLNFLELSHASTPFELPDQFGTLKELTNVILRGNKLKILPPSFGALPKLKYLDVSFNDLVDLPPQLSSNLDLQTLNASHNRLTNLPSEYSNLSKIAHVDLSFNEFSSFPLVLCSNFAHLAEVNLKSNKIESIPAEIGQLVALKTLDLSENQLGTIPGELGECTKLKEVHFEENRLKDKRLGKLIAQNQQKAILDYIRKNCPKEACEKTQAIREKTSSGGNKSKKDGKKTESDVKAIQMDKIFVLPSSGELKIVVSESVNDVRPFLLCCILKDVRFADSKVLKKFLTLQSKLHDEECKKRVAATIATHDLNKIRHPLKYSAKIPQDISIHPLGKHKDVTAEELMSALTEEAEALRKEKKRNVYSGIHQYLYLLKDKTKYPCLIDSENRVISLPPITNSEDTKISVETTNILVEVSSSQNLATCKRVMETLIRRTLDLNLNYISDEEGGEAGEEVQGKVLTVEQVKIFDEKDALKVAFPSKVDLQWEDAVDVVRDWSKVNED